MLALILTCSQFIGYLIVMLVSIIGIRSLFYFHSFFFHWPRYRQLKLITTDDIKALPSIPFVKIQITTRGLSDSTRVIRRGIENIVAFVNEAPDLYSSHISIEVITESQEQKELLEQDFVQPLFPVQAFALVIPKEYTTPKGTKLKARALHYMVELRRRQFNNKPGRTFIVHYDEESVMEPGELRKLIHYLATTPKPLSEGPIYYPLEYSDASMICRAMEANRPIGCFECREVMESGTPLHLHGSNLVIDEDLENALGWDIGTLDEQALVSEDYVFGVQAYLRQGPQIFGWHGCIMLEQPPFTLKSAFRQRYRWIIGVLQGIAIMRKMPEFHKLPWKTRIHLLWATRYRILTFALGLPTGVISPLYLLYQLGAVLTGHAYLLLPVPVLCWLVFVSFLWLNSMLIGAWYNLSNAQQLSSRQHWIEGMRVLTMAPFAGMLESSAGFWAVVQWLVGNRQVTWEPTPKKAQIAKVPRQASWRKRNKGLYEMGQLLQYTFSAVAVMVAYLVVPLMIILSSIFPYVWSQWLVPFEFLALGELAIFNILLQTTPTHEPRSPAYASQEVSSKPTTRGFSTLRLRQIAMRYGASVLMLGIILQGLLLNGGSPWSNNGLAQQAANSFQACTTQGTLSDTIQSSKPVAGQQRVDLQTGVIFPQWGNIAYSSKDQKWQLGLREIQQQTAAQWVGLAINLYQPSLISTQVQTNQATPTPLAMIEGIRAAKAMGYHVFVFPQLTVAGPVSWSGNIQFPTQQLAQAWFDNYWLAYKPYVEAAAQAGAEELAVGTEYELLQPAAPALWNQLIERIHGVFSGKLTYDMNWSSLYYPLPTWLHNANLSAIGVSVYTPLTNTPERLSPGTLPALWRATIGTLLDSFSEQVGKPVLISEIGYRNSADALYNPWEVTTNAQNDPLEQAAAYNAALTNIVADHHIAGVFAWAWEFPPFDVRCLPAAQVLHHWYGAQSAQTVTQIGVNRYN